MLRTLFSGARDAVARVLIPDASGVVAFSEKSKAALAAYRDARRHFMRDWEDEGRASARSIFRRFVSRYRPSDHKKNANGTKLWISCNAAMCKCKS